MRNKKKKENRILKALEIPEEILGSSVRFTVTDFRKIKIDNYKSLVEYGEKVIRINTGEKRVVIEGEEFDKTALTDESAEISGEIISVKVM